MKWAELFEIEQPQQLVQEIEEQKETCDRIIESKNQIIADFLAELKYKDEE